MGLRLTKAQLLAATDGPWDTLKGPFSSLAIFTTGQAHDSGYALMTIVGLVDETPTTKCTGGSDDISWKMGLNTYDGILRTDCILPARALHFWSNYGEFYVGAALSSIDIHFNRKKSQ